MNEKKNHIKKNPFILSLFKVLSDANSSSIISWEDNGQSFAIKDIQLFSKLILPKCFHEKSYSSFVKKLKLFGFTSLNNNTLEFSHPLFKPGNFSILNEIHPKTKAKLAEQIYSQDISKRVDSFRSQQNKLENVLQSLEETYSEIVEQNSQMIKELMLTRERELYFKEMLESISSKKSFEKDDLEEL